MINPIKIQTQLNTSNITFGKNNNHENVRTSIFYINDYHGETSNMEKTVSAVNTFDSFEYQKGSDKLKLASGDTILGYDSSRNKAVLKFMKAIGLMATALGNHDCEISYEDLTKDEGALPAKILACNADFDSQLNGKIQKSYIQEINGHKYGIIGTLPSDLVSNVTSGKIFQKFDVKPQELDGTILSVQREVDKLKSQGVNKIILLSHSGYEYDKEIAQKTEGIDAILGGHSHNLLKNVQKGVNLFYSKTGEPVIITQAGSNGKNFGILNLEFDPEGVIQTVQNNIGETKDFSNNLVAKALFEGIIGKPRKVGFVNIPPAALSNDLTDINTLTEFAVDALREKAGTQIALVGAGNIRGTLGKGEIDTAMISEISPFKNKIVKIEYTEKEIVDAIKLCAKSMTSPDSKPGLMYASGLRYTISKDGTLVSMKFIDRSGNEQTIDVNSPSNTKRYTVAINDYYSRGKDGLEMLNKYDSALEKYDWDINDAIAEKIKKLSAPIEFKDDGRIKISE